MLNKKLSILITSLGGGGAERVVSILLNELKSQYDITLVLMSNVIVYDIPDTIDVLYLENSSVFESGIKKILKLPILGWKYKNLCQFKNIDLSLSFMYRPNYINILAKIFGSKHKSIINIRSTTSRYKNNGILGKVNLFFINTLFDKADLIISNSKGVDEDLKSLINISTNTKVIYNPVDVEYINSKKDICEDLDFKFRADKKYIISVGRLIPLKRNIDLIKAFFELQKNDDRLELIFLGNGVLKNNLINQCMEFNIKEKVYFLGNVKNPFYYLKRSDLFVLSSEIEGFPNVLVEAMACGLPVISSDCKSGPREILEDEKYGLLYPVGDVDMLLNTMKYYLYEKVDREIIKNNNLKRIESFSVDKIINEFKKVLEIE